MSKSVSIHATRQRAVRLAASSCVAMAATLAPAAPVEAREARSEQVPNAQKLDCGLCHVDSAGGGVRNSFGMQIEAMGLDGEGPIETQEVVWANIYALDADGDGFTNGYELGDPDGAWVPTDGDPAVFPSRPGDPGDVPCPNNSVHPDEECDGDDLADQSCLGLGFTGGVLACNQDCTFDTSQCMQAVFPDVGGPMPDAGGSTPDSGQPPVVVPSVDGGVANTDVGGQASDDGAGGCAGTLEVREPDGGLQAAGLFLLLVLGGRRRR